MQQAIRRIFLLWLGYKRFNKASLTGLKFELNWLVDINLVKDILNPEGRTTFENCLICLGKFWACVHLDLHFFCSWSCDLVELCESDFEVDTASLENYLPNALVHIEHSTVVIKAFTSSEVIPGTPPKQHVARAKRPRQTSIKMLTKSLYTAVSNILVTLGSLCGVLGDRCTEDMQMAAVVHHQRSAVLGHKLNKTLQTRGRLVSLYRIR